MKLIHILQRKWYHLFFLILSCYIDSGIASAGDNYAAVAVYGNNGDIVLDYHSSKRVYPASITKLMTLYLAFEALSDGRIYMNDNVTISRSASLQPKSKIGLLDGETITVRNLILAAAIVSANDAAVALAEEIAGNTNDFVSLMNKKALDLGMYDTHFVNPTGLFDEMHYTTPKDIVLLSLALKKRFGEYYGIFSGGQFFFKGKAYVATNNIVQSFKGVDGLKTGYTSRSGYNLVCSFNHDGHFIIAAVFGFKSLAARDSYMRAVLDYSSKVILHKFNDKRDNGLLSSYNDFISRVKDTTLTRSHGYMLSNLWNVVMRKIISKDFVQNNILSLIISEFDWFTNLLASHTYPVPDLSDVESMTFAHSDNMLSPELANNIGTKRFSVFE